MSTMSTPSPNAGSQASICLVILGTSTHENVLRRSPEIDVIRARNAHDAIGELGYATEQHTDQRVVLLITSESPQSNALLQLLDAARLVVPNLRVLADEGVLVSDELCEQHLPHDGHAAVRCVLSSTSGAPQSTATSTSPAPSESTSTALPTSHTKQSQPAKTTPNRPP